MFSSLGMNIPKLSFNSVSSHKNFQKLSQCYKKDLSKVYFEVALMTWNTPERHTNKQTKRYSEDFRSCRDFYFSDTNLLKRNDLYKHAWHKIIVGSQCYKKYKYMLFVPLGRFSSYSFRHGINCDKNLKSFNEMIVPLSFKVLKFIIFFFGLNDLH